MTDRPNELFDRYFEVVNADTADRREAVYRLRYQVYCLETGFEDKTRFPDEKEHDRFDRIAQHALILRRGYLEPVATVRLVPGDTSRPGRAFPIEDAHPRILSSRGYGPGRLPYSKTAEISRFAVSRTFKRRAGEHRTLAGVSDANADGGSSPQPTVDDRRAQPLVILGLFLAIVRLSAANGYEHWLAAMGAPLLRRLSHFGIRFTPIGPPIQYHGWRQPCYGAIDEVLEGIFLKNRDIWSLITDAGAIWRQPATIRRSPPGAMRRAAGDIEEWPLARDER